MSRLSLLDTSQPSSIQVATNVHKHLASSETITTVAKGHRASQILILMTIGQLPIMGCTPSTENFNFSLTTNWTSKGAIVFEESLSPLLAAYPYPASQFLFNVVCSVLMIVVAVVGLVSNAIFIHLFRRSNSTPTSMDILLIGLAAADNALLLSGTPVYSVIALYTYKPSEQLLKMMNHLTVTLYPISMMAHCASVWTMVSISVERYIAVCHPLAARSLCSARRSVAVLCVVTTTSVLYNFCRFWEYRINEHNHVVPLLRSNELYVQVFVHWMYFFTVFGLPLFTLASVNCCIVHTIFRARRLRATMSRSQLRQHRLAVMMIVLVVIFFVSNTLAFVLNALEAAGFFDNMKDDKYIFYCLMDVNNLLVEFNSSINLYLYLIFCRRFRTRFCRMLRCLNTASSLPLPFAFPPNADKEPYSKTGLNLSIQRRNLNNSSFDATSAYYD
ncbi:FMRFamide receptor [Trichinella zimbabwensis]|uniref:FMRFamide receptor n=1 Tax=Trichinella zimbabwensis TaxID=268475 RepID=A0A0V1HAL0_9BILA|nr:FMRFamide receptor [Trichinella zimbabwensis]